MQKLLLVVGFIQTNHSSQKALHKQCMVAATYAFIKEHTKQIYLLSFPAHIRLSHVRMLTTDRYSARESLITTQRQIHILIHIPHMLQTGEQLLSSSRPFMEVFIQRMHKYSESFSRDRDDVFPMADSFSPVSQNIINCSQCIIPVLRTDKVM